MNEAYENYFQNYVGTLSEAESAQIEGYETTCFCNDEYNTNECAQLVAKGIKRATCSVKEAYKIEGEQFPQVGQHLIVLNWDNKPVCITKITDVSFYPFGQVSREFAESEGEGDGTMNGGIKRMMISLPKTVSQIMALNSMIQPN